MGVAHPRAQAVMREVQCLAQLDHRNVVRYHTSWLESGWMENGVGHGSARPCADFGAHGGASSGEAGAGNVAVPGKRGERGGSKPAPRTHAKGDDEVGGTAGVDPAREAAFREHMDALVPAHMQPELIKRLSSMLRSRDSVSEAGSGRGWDGDSDAGGGSNAGDPKEPWLRRLQGSLRSGTSNVPRVGSMADRRGSMSPLIVSPRNLPHSLPSTTRDRGFSNWSAEEAESETSRWSEASSSAAHGRDCFGSGEDRDDFDFSPRHVEEPPLSPAGYRTTVGVPAGRSPAQAFGHPALVRRRAEQFRHPSIDLDDLVSFGQPSLAGDGIVEGADAQGPHNDGRDVQCGKPASSAISENSGGNANGNGNGNCRGRGRRQARNGRRVRRGRRGRGGVGNSLTRRSVSPEGLIQYPVTLYIQMMLCPGDTLQDWLRKRNARLSSESDETDVGILLEAGANGGRPCPTPGRAEAPLGEQQGSGDGSPSESAASLAATVPALQGPSILSGNGPDPQHDPQHVKATPAPATSSPGTDPVSSDSSGGPDEEAVVEPCSASATGTLCPPPTRETSRNLRYGFSKNTSESPFARSGRLGTGGRISPTGSVSPVCAGCEWVGEPGSGRVDLHEALGMFHQLLDGIVHVHSKGIIHRDLKVNPRDCRSRVIAMDPCAVATDSTKRVSIQVRVEAVPGACCVWCI